MKSSVNIIVVGLIFPILLTFAQTCDKQECDETENGCCCAEAGGCYIFTGETVQCAVEAEGICESLNAALPPYVEGNAAIVEGCCHDEPNLPSGNYLFYTQPTEPDECTCVHVEGGVFTKDDHCCHEEGTVVICYKECICEA